MIYLIITTSLYNKYKKNNFENRDENYLNSIKKTLDLLPPSITPIIVENNSLNKSYLDNFNINVHYTNNNKNIYYHKGINELEDIKSVINKYNINDTDIIIKLTGRYYLLNNFVFNHIIDNQNNYDIFIKFFNVCEEIYNDNDCILGLYGIRCKYLKEFEYNNFDKSPEIEFTNFIREKINKERIFSYYYLYLRCIFCDNLKKLDV